MELTLVSHALCPYVQRAAIVLREKNVPFTRRDVDLSNKPDWFLAISPLGKTPVLLADGQPIFESAVICEFLDETHEPRLHPADARERSRHRGWTEFGSAMLGTIGAYYAAPDANTLALRTEDLRVKLAQLEAELGAERAAEGPYFSGQAFSIVDAVFAPVFRYFEVFEALGEPGLFQSTPRVRAWRAALAQRASVREAVGADYAERLHRFLLARGSELSRRIAAREAQPAAELASVK